MIGQPRAAVRPSHLRRNPKTPGFSAPEAERPVVAGALGYDGVGLRGHRRFVMVHAIALLRVERDRINEVAQELVGIEGVSEVYSVAGRWDLAVIVRARDDRQLADVVTARMLKVEGIRESETLIAFRVLSSYDLERMFAVGME
jgi:DNA-binding Lrp family transcriptional regulator